MSLGVNIKGCLYSSYLGHWYQLRSDDDLNADGHSKYHTGSQRKFLISSY